MGRNRGGGHSICPTLRKHVHHGAVCCFTLCPRGVIPYALSTIPRRFVGGAAVYRLRGWYCENKVSVFRLLLVVYSFGMVPATSLGCNDARPMGLLIHVSAVSRMLWWPLHHARSFAVWQRSDQLNAIPAFYMAFCGLCSHRVGLYASALRDGCDARLQ